LAVRIRISSTKVEQARNDFMFSRARGEQETDLRRQSEPFARGVFHKSPPWGIKPNVDECANYGGDRLKPCSTKGARFAILTGARHRLVCFRAARVGFMWFSKSNRMAEGARSARVSAVGSGDSLVGAWAAKWLESGDVWEAARWGVAGARPMRRDPTWEMWGRTTRRRFGECETFFGGVGVDVGMTNSN
jgi:fructose-1-phosphate kinase PfkB-like protein